MFFSAQIVVFFSFVEHFFYSFVCFYPGYFAKAKNPPQEIHKGLMVCKALQVALLFPLIAHSIVHSLIRARTHSHYYS